MNRWRSLVALMFVAAAGAVAGCTSGPPPPAVDARPYEERVQEWRDLKNQEFRTSAASPIPVNERPTFPGLFYYPVDRAMQVPASLTEERSEPHVIIELPTSTNQIRRMQRVGTLRFTLAGDPLTLTAFAPEGGTTERLFVPFGDTTNGTETYGGGRYLDLDRTPTGLYDLDFNQAYYPYCVYNPSYNCPVPPKENRLAVAVRAGERFAP